MDILILGFDQSRRADLEVWIGECLEDAEMESKIVNCGVSPEVILYDKPAPPSVTFIVIDSEDALHYARTVESWGEEYPMVMAATHPKYAIEGIRMKVKNYILFPIEEKDILESLKRTGVME